jgi:sulfite oxidase
MRGHEPQTALSRRRCAHGTHRGVPPETSRTPVPHAMPIHRSKERGLSELFRGDPVRADALAWGRRSDEGSRRGFLHGAGLATLSTLLGTTIPFARFMPAGLIPAAFADTPPIPGKNGLILLNDRPLNAETPAHLLDDAVTPAEHLFVRNNGLPPATDSVRAEDWELLIDGEACLSPRRFSLAALKRDFEAHEYQLQLECGGNGRAEFQPPATGNQWTTGAVGCPRWTGVRLRDVLTACGISEHARYIGYYGADRHLSGAPGKVVISRGVPMHKALEDETLIAWAMNGQPIPLLHGFPLRLVVGGWPGSVSGKWLQRIAVRDRVHDGAKMGGKSYRVPCRPVAPGEKVRDDAMCIIEAMPVKSLVTLPQSGITHPLDKPLPVRGQAWAGDVAVARVMLSMDFGATWMPTQLSPPANRLAWQRWQTAVRFPQQGYYELWARAVDSEGRSQPMVLPGWNPKGYLNNACHRIAVRVA